jgi:hypothetical protein
MWKSEPGSVTAAKLPTSNISLISVQSEMSDEDVATDVTSFRSR